jgi:alanine racemase
MPDFKDMPLAWAEINTESLKNNFLAVKKRVKAGTKITAVVKADAYGHGAVQVGKILAQSGVDVFAVAAISEGIELRDGGITLPILVLGYTPPEQAEVVLQYNLTSTICNERLVWSLAQAARKIGKRAQIHIKVDTGFGSDGILASDCLSFIRKIMAEKWLEIEGIFTHLVSAYGQDKDQLAKQLTCFEQLMADLADCGVSIPIFHAASSPAILAVPEAHYDMVRAGIILYGLSVPNIDLGPDFKPAMQLKARITSVNKVESGCTLGYGCTFPVDHRILIATVPIGYADGFFFLLQKNGEVLIHGQKAQICGQPRMDHFLVDVTDIPEIRIGDEVVVFGEQMGASIRAEEVSVRSQVGLLNCDAMCLLGRRVPRIYI